MHKRAIIPTAEKLDLRSHRFEWDGKTVTLTFYEGEAPDGFGTNIRNTFRHYPKTREALEDNMIEIP